MTLVSSSILSSSQLLFAAAGTTLADHTILSDRFISQAPVLPLGQSHTTFYAADPQFERQGARSWLDNAGVDRFIHSAHRSAIGMITSPLYVDTQLRAAKQRDQSAVRGIRILGDVTDTPCVQEAKDFAAVIERHDDLPVLGYDRGNHSSGNAFGVVNLLSRPYRWIKSKFHRPVKSLEQQLAENCGCEDNVQSPQKTLSEMHRLQHRHRIGDSNIETINRPVAQADYQSFQLEGDNAATLFTEKNLEQNFHLFWQPSRGTAEGVTSETPHWDCLVNYHVANLPVDERSTEVPPFYIQASCDASFELADGKMVPVYSISIDSNDTSNAVAVFPGVSELQVRLIEIFMDYVKRHQPEARFKLSSHFPVGDIINKPHGFFDIVGRIKSIFNRATSKTARKAFKKLLSREEVVLFVSAHTHGRHVENLTKKFNLKRESVLHEVVVPSLTDYSPYHREGEAEPHDGRALGIEVMSVKPDEVGPHNLKIDLNFRGLNPGDLLKECLNPEVQAAVDAFNRDHGYQRVIDVMTQKLGRLGALGFAGPLGRQLIWDFFKKRGRNFTGFFTAGMWGWLPFEKTKQAVADYWARPSVIQDFLDALNAVSVEQAFNEAEHMVPFLQSLEMFIGQEVAAGEVAAQAILTGVEEVRSQLAQQLETRRPQYESLVQDKADSRELIGFNDIFAQAEVDRLPQLLLGLSEQGPARAFAVMVGLESSRAEYEFQGEKPTQVPNKALSLSIPLG